MLTQPLGELAPTDAAGGEIKHEAFLIIHPGGDLSAVIDMCISNRHLGS